MVDGTESSKGNPNDLGAVFDEHVRHEFEDQDTSSKTMT